MGRGGEGWGKGKGRKGRGRGVEERGGGSCTPLLKFLYPPLIIQSLAEIHHINVNSLQQTHVNDDKSDRLSISGFDIISYTLHAKHGRATYVRSDVSGAARVSSSQCCDVIRVGGYHIANIYKPPTEHWNNTICHQSFLILQSWLETLTAIIQTGDIRRLI